MAARSHCTPAQLASAGVVCYGRARTRRERMRPWRGERMREDVVTPPMARRLQQAGLQWEPQLGDWCTVLASASLGEAQAGLWLVAAVANQAGMLGLMDA